MTLARERESKTVAAVGERRLIEMIQSAVRQARTGQLVSIGDDAAVLRHGRRSTRPEVVSTDMLVEGTHWRPGHLTPEQLGRRALVANLSDIAAMGAEPQWFTLGVAMPPTQPLRWFRGVLRGMLKAADEFQCPLIGGDLVRSCVPTLSITITGLCVSGRPCQRDAARVGDRVCVTGDLGRAELALAHLEGRTQCRRGVSAVLSRHRRPHPRLAEAAALVEMGAVHAMMDLSDGLVSDLPWIAGLSGVALAIDLDSLPMHGAVRRHCESLGLDPSRTAALSGEEFELLFTSGKRPETIQRGFRERGIETPVTAIGRVTAGRGVCWLRSGRPIDFEMRGDFDHFAQGSGPGQV